MQEDKNVITQIIQNWIEQLIIGMNLCPFAKDPYEKNAVRIAIHDAQTIADCMNVFEREIRYLAKHSKTETTLLVLPQLSDITVFNKLIQECEKWIFLKKWFKEYQITFFHPSARIQGVDIHSPNNLIIQAPFPILHILRVNSVEKLGAKVKEDVHTTNDKKLAELNAQEVQKIWQDIHKV